MEFDFDEICLIYDAISEYNPYMRSNKEEKLIEKIKAKLAGRDEKNKKERKKSKYKKGEKFYIEVEINVRNDKDSVWVIVPGHPENEYDGLCVYTKDLISKKDIEEEK